MEYLNMKYYNTEVRYFCPSVLFFYKIGNFFLKNTN
ncbi:hypothetical protein HMPREF9473_01853 [ [Hungatella hathewayi WAL-18680]|uniref:Uncharacterized protein n=1 Tax=Hungatella hathewayi WAL-18680 TaxID=742737 RepID=G5IEC6_9FIRM|nr:hypothetical protein HMPREF9473_01853 [ [Hungatella hathewayi WAL-18680]